LYRSKLKEITQRKICKGSLLNGTKAVISGLQVKYMMMGMPKRGEENGDERKQSIEKEKRTGREKNQRKRASKQSRGSF